MDWFSLFKEFKLNRSLSLPLRRSRASIPRGDGHKRGRSLENGLYFRIRDDDLALFNVLLSKERDNFLLQTTDDFDDILSSKLKPFPDIKLGINIPVRGETSDLLNADGDKNDYEWLLTPPDTPLFPSLDDEPAPANLVHSGRTRSRPISISRSSTMEKSQRSSRGSPSPQRLSPSPRSGSSTFRGRPSSAPHSNPAPLRASSPSRKPSPPPVKSSTSPSRSHRTAGSSGSVAASGMRGISPVRTRRGNSAPPKTRVWQSNITGLSLGAPSNIRTSIADRPASYVRGSSPASRSSRGRQSMSPTTRSIGSSHSEERYRLSSHSKGVGLTMSTMTSAGIDSSEESEDILSLKEQYHAQPDRPGRWLRRMSINEMTESKMKDYCFLFLFPSDYEFEKETLVNMCMDFDFLGEIDEWFGLLLSRSYLLISRKDILRGRILYKVNYDKIRKQMDREHVKEDEVLYGWFEDCSESWHISLVCSYINQTTFEILKVYGSKLKTLLFVLDYGSSLTRIPPDLFLTHEYITTLDLSGSHITELPTSIGNAKFMRYLDLSFTLLESLPESIVHLSRLQTLKLQGCKYLYKLPKGTKKLIHLRHLDFDVLGQLSFLPEGMGALTNLQTLSAFVINSEEGSSIKELKTMNKLSGKFCISGLENVSCVDIHEAALQNKTCLTHLQLRWNDRKLYSIDEQNNACNIIANVNLSYKLKELNIVCYPGLEFPAWIDFKLHWNLTSITLFKCENTELNLPIGQLPNLKYLSIVHMNKVTKIDGRILKDRWEHIAGFPSLEKLEIDSLSSIQVWTDVSHEDFPRLSKLVIKQCPMLIDLPFLPYLHSLRHLEISRCIEFKRLPEGVLSPSLETLIIDDCPLLEERCAKKGEDWYKIKHVPSIWIDLEDICSIHEDAVDQDDNLTSENLGFTVSQKEVGAVEFSLPKRNEGAYQTDIEPDPAGFFDSQDTSIGLNLLDESCNSDNIVLPEMDIVNKTLVVSSHPEVIEAKVVETDHYQEVQLHGGEEFDVERVIKEQTTRDLFCPICLSCITHRVITKRNRVTGKTSKREASEVKPGQMNPILLYQDEIASGRMYPIPPCLDELCIGTYSLRSLGVSCNSDDCVLPEINDGGSILNRTHAVSSRPEVIEFKVVETDHSQAVQSHGEEEEFDVERVIKEQTTHDLFCPICRSCITHRVITKRNRVTGKTSKREASEIKTNSILPSQD